MQKRVNKTKDELKAELLLQQELNREEFLSRPIFAVLKKQETIYDAQTLLHALSGYIFQQVEKRTSEIKVGDLPIDTSKEKEGPIKEGFAEILEILKDEKAETISKFLKRYGDMLGYYGAKEFLKKPMTELTEEDIIIKPKIK